MMLVILLNLSYAVLAVGREIKILRLFRHGHIIRLHDVLETHDDIYVVMEYVRVILSSHFFC